MADKTNTNNHDLIGLILQLIKAVVGRNDIVQKLDKIERGIEQIIMDQATFDTDLATLVTAVGSLTVAIDAWIAAHPAVDFTAEDTAVQNAAAAVAAELAKVTPTP